MDILKSLKIKATNVGKNLNIDKGCIIKKVISIVLISLLLSGIFYPVGAQEVRKPKSGATAVFLSLGASVIPIGTGLGIRFGMENNYGLGLAAVGVIVGPSVGHFYANQWGRGLKSAGLRAGIITVPVALLMWADVSQDLGKLGIGLLTLIPTVGILAGLTINDIVTAPSSVRKYNESIGKTGNVYLMPRINMEEESYGLSIVYNF